MNTISKLVAQFEIDRRNHNNLVKAGTDSTLILRGEDGKLLPKVDGERPTTTSVHAAVNTLAGAMGGNALVEIAGEQKGEKARHITNKAAKRLAGEVITPQVTKPKVTKAQEKASANAKAMRKLATVAGPVLYKEAKAAGKPTKGINFVAEALKAHAAENPEDAAYCVPANQDTVTRWATKDAYWADKVAVG